MRILILFALLPLAACDDGGDGARKAALVKAARAGMNTVRGIPGGRTASFTEVRLVGTDTVCGKIDGNEGDGPRAFSAKGQEVLVEDPRDPATLPPVTRACVGSPVHRIISRNDHFSDLTVAD